MLVTRDWLCFHWRLEKDCLMSSRTRSQKHCLHCQCDAGLCGIAPRKQRPELIIMLCSACCLAEAVNVLDAFWLQVLQNTVCLSSLRPPLSAGCLSCLGRYVFESFLHSYANRSVLLSLWSPSAACIKAVNESGSVQKVCCVNWRSASMLTLWSSGFSAAYCWWAAWWMWHSCGSTDLFLSLLGNSRTGCAITEGQPMGSRYCCSNAPGYCWLKWIQSLDFKRIWLGGSFCPVFKCCV